MVQIIPAVDLIDGRVVRLRQGDFNRPTFYPIRFLDLVRRYRERGFRRIHVVDLDGARAGFPQQIGLLNQLTSVDRALIEWSGGIRSVEDAELVEGHGVEGIMLGSVCARNLDLASRIQDRLRINVRWAVDIRGETVATDGWVTESSVPWRSILNKALASKVSEVMISSIAHDGMACGPNLSLYEEIQSTFPALNVIASGGIRGRTDLDDLGRCGIKMAIIGRALLENEGDFL